MKSKIIKILALITLFAILLSAFSGCKSSKSKKDPSEMIEGETQAVEIIPEEDKDLRYYEKLATTSRPKIKYDGVYVLAGKSFKYGLQLKDLQKEFTILEGVKDKKLNAFTNYKLTCGAWTGNTKVEIYNPTDKTIPYYDCEIASVSYPVDTETKLYDLIGEQLVAIPEGYIFVESVFYVFGSPQALDKDKKQIDVTYVLPNYETENPQKEIWINLVFDNESKEGSFKITYE